MALRVRVTDAVAARLDFTATLHLGKQPEHRGPHQFIDAAVAAGVEVRRRDPIDYDQDGVPDRTDRCVWVAEDVNGRLDEDGCPELDDDLDEIPDHLDRCPLQAVARDGFEDADGCPDLNDDGDRWPDAVDQCVLQAETENGWLDGDGCPDEGPAALVALEGVLPDSQVIAAFTALAAEPRARIGLVVHADLGAERAQREAAALARVEVLRSAAKTRGLATRAAVWAVAHPEPAEPRLRAREVPPGGWVELSLLDPTDVNGQPMALWDALPYVPAP